MGMIIPYDFTSRDGTRILLRSAEPRDVRAVLQLSYDVIKENDTLVTSTEEFFITEDQQRDFIHLYKADPGNVMIVAEHNRNIIGILTFQRGALLKYAHHGSVGMIVDINWRGKGIGKALLATLIQWADYNPMLEKLCLEVLASNKNAITLYKSFGFIEEGRQINQVKRNDGRYEDLIIMGKFLNFEV
ncbi:MAG: GNAT family N-acetyltransferase [Anaerobacillus sp.]|uniref:GNAT family N-acetyltransferase n=1 Tax=Anaerobacillus sp. TaxID=1872506 RepID=UPI00391CBF8A